MLLLLLLSSIAGIEVDYMSTETSFLGSRMISHISASEYFHTVPSLAQSILERKTSERGTLNAKVVLVPIRDAYTPPSQRLPPPGSL
jgi:hypothetical protein